MRRHSVQPRNRTFVKVYGFSFFAENIGSNVNKIWSSKYSQKLIGHAKQSETDTLKAVSKEAIQKTAEATDDLISNETASTIIKVSRNSPDSS